MSTTLKSSKQSAVSSQQKGHASPSAHYSLLTAHSSPTRWAWLVLVGLTLMFVIAALWRPADEPALVLCPFRALTHYPCPGCGMTRAFCALAHGEFWRAIKFNALSPLLFLAALAAWAWAAATIFKLERLRLFLARLPVQTPTVSKLMLALVLMWWVARLAGGF